VVEGEEEKLQQLAKLYGLHPLHIEDCHHGGQNAKYEEGKDYLFVVLKPVRFKPDFDLEAGDFDVFLSEKYLITYEETGCTTFHDLIQRLQPSLSEASPDEIFYKLMDNLVDSYSPILDQVGDEIDRIEDIILECPTPKVLQTIFTLKRSLIHMRRVLTQTRDVAGWLMHGEQPWIRHSLRLYFRDVYDHLTRDIETVEMSRDLISGALDIYLTTVANRTNDTMKVLALFSAITLPTVAISSFFGMNFEFMPWIHNHNGLLYTLLAMICATLLLALISRWRKWI
jgi:magnesium transporter